MTPPTTTPSLVEPARGLGLERPDTRPAPIETVTPMLPSTAIRLGCLIAPVQAFGNWFTNDGAACALGAMILGFVGGRDDARPSAYIDFMLGDTSSGFLAAVMKHNDTDRWSRERIADWLAEQGL